MISEIDLLFAKYINEHINKQLGPDLMQKINTRLLEKGYSLTQAIKEFDLFDKILREFFGKGTDGMLQKIFYEIFEIKKGKTDYGETFLIKDKDLSNLILSTYGNQEKKMILEYASESALSIADILNKINLPQSTGYRIINSLINDGLLIEAEQQELSQEGRKVSTYKSTISLVDIRIKKSSIVMEVHFTQEIVKKSRIMTTIIQSTPKLRT